MSWSVASMQSAGPDGIRSAGTTISPTLDQNNDVLVDDFLAIALVFDNTSATAPNVSWSGALSSSAGAPAVTAITPVYSNSPVASSGGGLRTAMLLCRVTAAGTITSLNGITFSASITAKIAGVARVRGGDFVSFGTMTAASFSAVSGANYGTRSINNPSGSGDFLVLSVAGIEGSASLNSTNNGVITGVDGSMSGNTPGGGQAATHLGMWFGWEPSYGSSISQSSGGATNADASSLMVAFGNAWAPTPIAPTARTLSAPSVGAGKVTLAWNVDLVAYPSAVYDVEYSTDQSNWTRAFTDLSSSSGVAVTGLTNDVLYYFRVRGGNSAGEAPWSNIVSGTPVAFLRRHNFETGADGVDISFDNAPGASGVADAFDYILNSGNGPPRYSAAQKYNGSLSGFFSQSSIYNESVVGWNFGANAMDIWYGRFYLYITGAPGAETKLVQVGAPGDNPLFSLNLTVGARLRFDSAGGTTSAILPNNQWVRVELMNAYADETVGRVYFDPAADVFSADSEFTKFIGGLDQIGTAKFGVMTSSGAVYMDDIAMGENGGWIGPSSAPPPATANAGQFGMIPIF